MSIKNIKERLEGSYRLIRIKRIKLGFFILEIALALVLGAAMAMLMKARFEPLFFPVDVFLFPVLIIILVMSAEAIYFKGLEIRYTRNKSRKFLLAKNSIMRAFIIIAVSALCLAALMLPMTQEKIDSMHEPSAGPVPVAVGETSHSATFQCQDRFGLARASMIRIVGDQPYNVSLFLGVEGGNNYFWRSTSDNLTQVFGGIGDHSGSQNTIYVVVENLGPAPLNFTYEVTSDTSPMVKAYFPILCVTFIVVQLVSVSVMLPIREANASGSIYSKDYVATTDSGEYTVSQIKVTKHDIEEERMLDRALDLELPPQVAAPPVQGECKLPEREEMARAKGSVDDGLVAEPDVKCPSCGEMNSADSAMCFSCGHALEAMAKVAVDPKVYLDRGLEFSKIGKWEDAASCYGEVLRHDTSSEVALLRMGEALHKLDKWGQAVQYINTALKVNPNNVDALVLKARILEERDRVDKSMELYSQILALDPDNEFARSKMEAVSRKFVQTVEEAELESTEDVLQQFMEVPGVGLARATALYEAGFTSMDMLKNATEARLAEVKGISKGIAKKIKKGLESL